MIPEKPKNHTPHYATTPSNEDLDKMIDNLLSVAQTLHTWMVAHPLEEAQAAIAHAGATISKVGMSLAQAVEMEKHQREHCKCSSDDIPAHKQHAMDLQNKDAIQRLLDSIQVKPKNRIGFSEN